MAVPFIIGALGFGYLFDRLVTKHTPTITPDLHEVAREKIVISLHEKHPLFDVELIDHDLYRFLAYDEEEAIEESIKNFDPEQASLEARIAHEVELESLETFQRRDWEVLLDEQMVPIQMPEVRLYEFSTDRWVLDAPEFTPLDPTDLIRFGMVCFASCEEQNYNGVPFDLGGKELLIRDWFRMLGYSVNESEELEMKGVMPWRTYERTLI